MGAWKLLKVGDENEFAKNANKGDEYREGTKGRNREGIQRGGTHGRHRGEEATSKTHYCERPTYRE